MRWEFYLVAIAALVVLALILSGCGASTPAGSTQKPPPNTGYRLSPDGKRIVLFANDAKLYILDLERGAGSAFLPELTAAAIPQFIDNERLLMVSHGEKGTAIEIVGLDGKRVRSIAPGRAFGALELAPDRKHAVCMGYKDKFSHIMLIDLETDDVRALTPEGVSGDRIPIFADGGKAVVFIRGTQYHDGNFVSGAGWSNNDFWAVNLDGSGLKQLTHQSYTWANMVPYALDKGAIIAYTAYTETDPGVKDAKMCEQIFSFAFSGGEPKVLKIGDVPVSKYDGAVYATLCSISNDGKKIAFFSDRALSYEYNFWVSNVDGSAPAQISKITMKDVQAKKEHWLSQPEFSPDGKTVYLYSRMKDSLFRVDVDGGNFRLVGTDGVFARPMEWKP